MAPPLYREMMKAKLHRATVTEANLNYVGSITIDPDLIEAVDIVAHEKVQVVNNNNGARLETYVIPGRRGSREICINGAAARLAQPGDRVIIITYAWVAEDQLAAHHPKVALLDEENRIVDLLSAEPAGMSYP